MLARNDRKHDIAAWFGLNQGRIKEVADGDYGTAPAANPSALPPSGSPGPRAKVLRAEAKRVLKLLEKQTPTGTAEAIEKLKNAITEFDEDVD